MHVQRIHYGKLLVIVCLVSTLLFVIQNHSDYYQYHDVARKNTIGEQSIINLENFILNYDIRC